MSLGPGIHQIPASAYHADPAAVPSLSASIAHTLIEQSPLHAWTEHPRLNPDFRREEEQKFAIGTAAHALMLEGRNAVEVIGPDEWRTNEVKAQVAAARDAGRIPIKPKDWDRVSAMVDAAKSQALAINCTPPLFRDGKPEQTLVWEEDGVWCRALVDWLRDDFSAIDDYKTTGNGPDAWTRRTLYGIGADIQVAFYLRGMEALTGKRPEWRFVVQEAAPPYCLFVVQLAPSVLEIAEAKVDRALELWRGCMESGSWPGYPAEVHFAELPGWEEARWLERETREAA